MLISACSPDLYPTGPTPIVITATPLPADTVTPVNVSPTATMVRPITATPSATITHTPTPYLSPTPTRNPQFNGQVSPGSDRLRLRVSPNTSGQVLDFLDELTQITIIEQTEDGIWYRIVSEDRQQGWVMSQYVELYVEQETIAIRPPDTATPVPVTVAPLLTPIVTAQVTTAATIGIVPPTAAPTLTLPATELALPAGFNAQVAATGQGLRLRDQPSLNATIITMLPERSFIQIIGRNADSTWYQVNTPDGQQGWVFAQYVQVHTVEIASLPVPEAALIPTPTPGAANTGGSVPRGSVQIFLRGQSLGNRPNLFSKVGDSITATGHFMYPLGWGWHNLHEYGYLQEAINFFASTIARDNNAFIQESLAARPGWTTVSVLDPGSAQVPPCEPGEAPLVCEYRIVRPSVALIMLGTNDVGLDTGIFQANLEEIIRISSRMGVIPILSTIPIRYGWEDKVHTYNQIITSLANSYGIPLIDYYSVMIQLPNNGLDPDGVHPSFVGADYHNYVPSGDFSAENLQYGFPRRNLITLQMLDTIWRTVIAPNMR